MTPGGIGFWNTPAFAASPHRCLSITLQAIELRTSQETLRGCIDDVKANLLAQLDEVRQQAAHRYASEIERLQDQSEMLFSTWSEGLKDELEGRQDRVIQQLRGEEMAMEIRMRDIDAMIAQLSQKFDSFAQLSNDMTRLKVRIEIPPSDIPNK